MPMAYVYIDACVRTIHPIYIYIYICIHRSLYRHIAFIHEHLASCLLLSVSVCGSFFPSLGVSALSEPLNLP